MLWYFSVLVFILRCSILSIESLHNLFEMRNALTNQNVGCTSCYRHRILKKILVTESTHSSFLPETRVQALSQQQGKPNVIASIPVSTSYLSSPTHHRPRAAASTRLAGKALVWSNWRLACQQENHKPCLLHQHGLFFRAPVPLMILIKVYGTGRSQNYQNWAAWKTGRGFFSTTENNTFLLTKKNWHFRHRGKGPWSWDLGQICTHCDLHAREDGAGIQGPLCVFGNDTPWAVSPLRG